MSSFYGGGGGGGLSSGDLEAITSKIFKFEIVNALPENNISDSTIYLVLTGEQEDNIYTEYVYINNHWEKFGTQKIDLTNYVTLEFFDEKLAAKQDNLTAGSNISITDVDGEFIISAVDTTYSDATQQTHGLMSTADKTKLDGITAAKMQAWDAAEQNVNADWTAESGDAQILHKPDLSVYALAANVTKSALGIDNVDNTSDADKPISTATETALAGKVDKETGKSLMTSDEHTKLNDIEAGAQVNVQSDWEQNNSNADDFIKNKPANLVQDASYVHTDNNFTNAEKAKADGAIQSTEKGTAGGVAELDEYGHVPVSQLPSFVSDVIEGYYDSETTYKFYADAQHQTEIQGQSNKIYVDVNANLSYRWSGSIFVEVSPSLALGSTDSTAYRGDWGTADHAAIGILASLNTSEKSSLVAAINELQSGSVSVDPDRGLSENDFTDSLKSKLDGIESGAEVNVQSDWNQTDSTADDFIKNKPLNIVQDSSYVHTDNNYTTEEKTKLGGIESGAEANVQSDWNQSDTTADDFIKNKPTNATASAAGLMSPADFKKINAQPIAANSDLNDIKGDGWYFCSANFTAATLSHCPTTLAFYMEVHKHVGVYQHIVEYYTSGEKHFHRNFYNDVWGNWVEWKLTDTTYSNATPSTHGVGGSAGLMSAADKEKLDGMTAVLNAEILFDSASGTAVTNASPSITFDSGKSLSSYTDGYLEVFYKQNAGTNGGVNAVRTLIHSVSGTVTVEPVQLLGWTYNSANTALSLLACAGTVSNGNTITFSNPENANFSFTIYRIVGYK